MNLIDRTVATSQRSVAQTEQVFRRTPTYERFYFHMRLSEKQTDPRASWKEVDLVESGKAYVLHVIADPDSDNRTTVHPITMSSDVEFSIRCKHGLIRCDTERRLVTRDQVWNSIYEFQVEVDRQYVADAVTIELCYRRTGRSGDPIRISELQLKGQTAWLQEQFPTRQWIVDASLTDSVRILHVKQKASSSTLDICSYWDEEPNFRNQVHKPAMSPARFMIGENQPRGIIDRSRERSADNPPAFERWLKMNLGLYGDRFCLVILDDSDEYDMAWELIHIDIRPDDKVPVDDDMRGEVPIGALFPIVRWIPELRYHGEDLTLSVSETTITGDVIAYLDPTDTSHIETEKRALAQCGANPISTIQAFRQRLEAPLANTALIYMGCHGRIIVDNDQEHDLLFGSLSPKQQFTIYDLAGLGFLNPKEGRPLVFVNACHSAFTMRKEGVRHGLPVTLLRRVAGDFLGTIGPVDSKFAAQFAWALLMKAGEQHGVRLATALLEQRAAVVKRVRQDANNPDNWFDYLFTFMYVYYGNPYMSLHLLPAGCPEVEVSS